MRQHTILAAYGMIFRIDLKGDVAGVFETLKLFHEGRYIPTQDVDLAEQRQT
jgi:hypothetical protein